MSVGLLPNPLPCTFTAGDFVGDAFAFSVTLVIVAAPALVARRERENRR